MKWSCVCVQVTWSCVCEMELCVRAGNMELCVRVQVKVLTSLLGKLQMLSPA